MESALSLIRDSIREALKLEACPSSRGLYFRLCEAVPNCTCRECWLLAIMYALKEEVE